MNNIRIEGRKWFDKRYGNTYFSAVAYVDGEEVAKIPYAYGYGDQYVQEMSDILEQKEIITGRHHYSNGVGREPLWQWCRDLNVKFYYNATDVSRKKDL